ncbi:CoA transferase [Nocardia vinacea]|uniref:CoA transferase n=1 Tax=Nocardia vinacea TaxID=96468 RepID=A0ABZ1YU97_9NOCA|nr:CaiB/BaiF CoA-transferase family protein [Nocardia vinacea]
MTNSTKPLSGIRVVDLSTLGPGPFASMILASHGADVIQIQRPGTNDNPTPYFNHDKRIIGLDLKNEEGRDVARKLISTADVVIEGYRPGAMARLGLGPDTLCEANPRLIYVHLTGWGQDGPYATRAGHDINYISIAGALGAIGGGHPTPPLAIVGDFAGGGLFAVIGVLLALRQRESTGRGQVVDAAIVDGVSTLMWSTLARTLSGIHREPGTNLTDGGRPYYRAYPCADGKFFALGAIEPQFYAVALVVLGLGDEDPANQNDPTHWPVVEAKMTAAFRTRTRDEWTERFAGTDGCGAPVLEVAETLTDPHLVARGTVVPAGDTARAHPAPRLSAAVGAPTTEVEEIAALFAEIDLTDQQVDQLVTAGVLHIEARALV